MDVAKAARYAGGIVIALIVAVTVVTAVLTSGCALFGDDRVYRELQYATFLPLLIFSLIALGVYIRLAPAERQRGRLALVAGIAGLVAIPALLTGAFTVGTALC